jgi:hypothetical protein
MYKVRFNLGRGENFMKWKITNLNDNTHQYVDPKQVDLSLVNCELKNYKTTATKINEGSNKTVCAWIICESVKTIPTTLCQQYHRFPSSRSQQWTKISYNPRVKPYWTINEKDVDGDKFDNLETNGTKIFTLI